LSVVKRASEKHFCAVNIWNQVVTPGDAIPVFPRNVIIFLKLKVLGEVTNLVLIVLEMESKVTFVSKRNFSRF